MANLVVHRLTAEQLVENYGVTNYGPFIRSDQNGTVGFSESKCFQEIKLTTPRGTKLTKELVQKVVGTWVDMNLANQEFVRANVKFTSKANPNETPLYESLKSRQPETLRFKKAFESVNETIAKWQPYADAGYEVTIIK